MELLTAGRNVLHVLNEAGYEAYFVGGMVRDQLLNVPIYDIDVTTSATPEQVMALFEKTVATGIKHGTVTVLMNQIPVEVTTYRIERGYNDYRHPNEVIFSTSLTDDLKRRDFTMNTMAMNISGKVFDPLNGMKDLNNHLIKCVGIPKERFTEDPLRILRGIRFVSKFGFELEIETFEGMKEAASLIAYLSKERIKKELDGMMKGEYRQKAVAYLYEGQLLNSCDDLSLINRYHAYDFTNLNHPILLFALVGLEVENLSSYLKAWPFSKEERKCIEALVRGIKELIPITYFCYRYQEKWSRLYHDFYCFVNQVSIPYPDISLPISNRKELAIDVETIQQLISRPKGPWLQSLLMELEYQVVMGILSNDQPSIIKFIEKYQEGEC